MQYKLTYDVNSCSKELKRDFNIDSVMSEDDLSFSTLKEFKSYVDLLKEIQNDNSNITINDIIFRINQLNYSIYDNTTFCIIKLYCVDDKYIDEDDDRGENVYKYSSTNIDSLIQAYTKAVNSPI